MNAVSESAPRLRRTWPQRLVLALGIVAILGTVGGAVGVAYLGRKYDEVEKYDLSLTRAKPGEPANYLVVGSDSRAAIDANDPNAGAFVDGTASGRRSDTILIVRVDPETESATMLSLPRDLWVPIAGTGANQRINSAYGRGKQVLADTIQQYLGIPINHYVEVDFRGFQQLVNAIGGVPMYFERAMKDTNSGLDVLHPGCVTLDGASGLAFARSRHLQFIEHGEWRSDPTGDLGRITRQQLFVRKAVSRSVSKGLTNPITLTRLIDIGVANVGIDDGLTPKALSDLGRRFARFQGSQLVTLTVPVTPFRTDGGADVLRLDAKAAVPTLDLFRSDTKGMVPGAAAAAPTKVATDPTRVAVRVLNGAAVDKRAANVAGALQHAGFWVVGTGNVSDIGGEPVDRTEIRYNPADAASATLLARHLHAGARLVTDADTEQGALVLVVGRDFTTVTARLLPAIPGRVVEPTTTTTAPKPTTPSGPTTTVAVGRTPGEVPPGVSCG